METEAIKSHLPVFARSIAAMHLAEHVQIGRVDHVEGECIKVSKASSEDAHHHWVPLTWVEKVTDDGVYLSKSVDEYLWERLDEIPKH